MAISDKLTYLNGTKTKIREGLNSLGADLTTEDTFRSYADVIENIYEDYPKITGEGESLTLDNTKQALMNIDLKGNTSQDGTPTPTTPIDVNVVSGDNEINICGKNLFDEIFRQGSEISTSPTNYCFSNNDLVLSSGTYTLVNTLPSGFDYAIFGTTNPFPTTQTKTYNSRWKTGTTTFTINQDLHIGILVRKGSNNITPSDISSYTFMIYKGTYDSSLLYEPYQSQSYAVNLGTMELCKIGDYQDYIYKDNGSWYLHKEIEKYTFTENETGSLQTNNETTYLFNISGKVFSDGELENNTTNYINNYSLPNSTTSAPVNTNLGSYIFNKTLRIRVPSSIATTYAQFQTWLSSANCVLYYPLATPTNTLIEDTTLIEQLEALKLANSYEGQTNISQVNNDLPFILDVKALRGE